MENSEKLQFNAPSLPTGGGALNGLKGSFDAPGAEGAASLSVLLPISSGRGYAPQLALNYHSRSGNGPFGMGWNITLPSIHRRTNKGAPAYQITDEILGPDGEIWVPRLNEEGKAEQRETNTLCGVDLGNLFNVYSYRSRVLHTFSHLEYWVAEKNDTNDFWVLYNPDGQLHLFGKNAHARLSNPQHSAQTAAWLLESSVSATGEQIYYQYLAEDETNCSADEIKMHREACAQRYLTTIYYGNIKAGSTLPGLEDAPLASEWLFMLVLDYGEQSRALSEAPVWQMPGTGKWLCRQDCFSGYEYGFELRTRRLCHQVLMFHRLATLADQAEGEETPVLISRLLLEYDENPAVSTLISARQLAYEPDEEATMRALPPLEFGWQTFNLPEKIVWQERDDLKNLNSQQPYQFIDLNGEGLAGLLYRDSKAWWYRAPTRKIAADDRNAVSWSEAKLLPLIPSLISSAILTDLNGEGKLQWVVTAPGGAGYYSRTPEQKWLHFTPLSALPVEYANPQAQLADLLGTGLSDIVLIGPKSVRLYRGGGTAGWKKGQTVIQSDGVQLPIPGADARTLVAFSDLPGSGQQHLVEVKAKGVRYWPNLGHGRFGEPVEVPGFKQPHAMFNPDQVFLADIDGSGTTDLIYAFADRLEIYLNQSGNRFATPFTIALPEGVRYNWTCSLQVADFRGLGVAELLLSVAHPTPRHWLCCLSNNKPWLLNRVNNNMGASHILHYRSSAQFWLDEKVQAQEQARPMPACYLPFPIHTLSRTEVEDEITGNRLVSEMKYQRGAWEGHEREFCGFAHLEVQDTNLSMSLGTAVELSPPSVTRSWFFTGLPEVDEHLAQEFWQDDPAAFKSFTPRFTKGSGLEEKPYLPDASTAFWMRRALRGLVMRTELYGADGSEHASIPYSVTENRPQVRLVQDGGTMPVVFPSLVESRTYIYERIINDPQCSQRIVLTRDEYGKALKEVNICYPRRNKPASSPYPDTLPETLFSASYDEQQQVLRLNVQQMNWHYLVEPTMKSIRRILPDGTRNDVFIHPFDAVPSGGLTLELLQESDSLICDSKAYKFVGQQQIWYQDKNGKPTVLTPAWPPLVAFTASAVFDDEIVENLSPAILTEQIQDAAYQQSDYLFARYEETQVWVMYHGHVIYNTADHFWLPVSYRETLLTGVSTLKRDKHDCVITEYQDAAGLMTQAEYDYRFLTPQKLIDSNDNVHTMTLDALGRLTTSRFAGTEEGVKTGYSAAEFKLPIDVDNALQLDTPIPVAQYLHRVPESWMPEACEDSIKQIVGSTEVDSAREALIAAKVLTEDRRLRASALWRPLPSELARWANWLRAILSGIPPHILILTTDRYDKDPAQQIRQQVIFSDGFGRMLQTSIRQSAGEALERNNDGSIMTDVDGIPQTATTDFRWSVTGRTEYDNKGQPVRIYQPYFLNDWRYVSNDTARTELYADTYFYDPSGRTYQIKRANGYWRRQLFTPWFTVNEDENDTASM